MNHTLLAYFPDYDEAIDNKRRLSAALLCLTARQERVIRERFGFNCPQKTFKDIAEELGRSVEAIRHIYAKALRRLRMFLRVFRVNRRADLGGANFGEATPPCQSLTKAKHYNGAHWRLVPFIRDLAATGKAPHQIFARLSSDFDEAIQLRLLPAFSHRATYVPLISEIELILSFPN